MDAAPPPAAPASVPPPAPAAVLSTWPRSAQLATAFLLGLAAALVAVHAFGSSRWASKPAQLERGTEPTFRVDLNQASRAELLQLPGVGDSLADRIEAFR